jgi:hypothetical protein
VPKVIARYVAGLDTAEPEGLEDGEVDDWAGYSSGNYLDMLDACLMFKMRVPTHQVSQNPILVPL